MCGTTVDLACLKCFMVEVVEVIVLLIAFPITGTRSAQVSARHGACVTFVLVPTDVHVFPFMTLFHRRGSLEVGQNVMFKHQDDFSHWCLENGASLGLIQTSKGVSATFGRVHRTGAANRKKTALYRGGARSAVTRSSIRTVNIWEP